MPGIVGFFAANPAMGFGKELDLMVESMMHEKVYRAQKLRVPEVGASIGWIGHAGSFADCMPVWNEAKDIVLLLTGEEFSGSDEGPRLRAAGHDCRNDDASYLVHLYEERGDDFLTSLNGTFAGVIVDLRQQRALLFNDRHGLSRIYYYQDERAFWFASEAKALLRLHPELRRFDETALAEYLGCGCPLDQRSLFAGLALLPAASRWGFAGGDSRREQYFRIESWAEQEPLPPGEFVEAYAETLARIVPRYFAGRQQVAVSATGGLDSRLMAAWAPRTPYLIPCYTFSGMYNTCCDAVVARQVARQWQQYHHTITLGKGFFADFPGLAKKAVFYSDGTQDVTGAVSLFVNRLARQIAPVRITGNYGDEVMRDNTTLKTSRVRPAGFAPDVATQVAMTGAKLAAAMSGPRLTFILTRQLPWLHYSRLAVEQSQLTVRTPFLDNALLQLQYRCPPAYRQSVDLALGLIARGDPGLARFPTDRGHLGRRRRSWNLPREWWQAATTRAEYLFDYGMPQALVGRCEQLTKWNPERWLLGRHKYYHFRTWYRNELAGYVKDTLLDTRTLARQHLDRTSVERLVNEHTSGRANHTLSLHKLLSYELVHRQFIDAPQWS